MLSRLIKVRLQLTVGSLLGRRRGRGRFGIAALLALFALLFGFMSASLAFLFAGALLPSGLDSIFFAVFNVASFSIVFVFSIFETKSELFECRDNDLLLSMPVPSRYIVLSRVLSVLILNLAESAVIMLPAIVIYAAFGGGALYAIGGIITTLLLALLATVIATGVGYLVALVTSYFKNKSLITVVMYVLFFVLYFVGYGFLMGFVEQLELDPDGAAAGLEAAFGGMKLLGEISLLGSAAFFVFLGISGLLAVLAYVIISRHYVSIITRTGRGRTAKYRKKVLVSGSSFCAMCKKELLRFFSCPSYILNGAAGCIFAVILAVYLIADGVTISTVVGQLMYMAGIDPIYGPLAVAIGVVVLISSMNMTSSSALSLEGGSFWILKTSPVYTITVLHAKLVPHLCLALSAAILVSVCLGVALGLQWFAFVLLIAVAIVANLLFAIFGLIMNVLMPKFDFENVNQVVKNSGAASISILVGIVFSMLTLGAALGLCYLLDGLVAIIIVLSFLVALCATAYFVLSGPVCRRAQRLEP